MEQKRSSLGAELLVKDVMSLGLQRCWLTRPQKGIGKMPDEASSARAWSRMASGKTSAMRPEGLEEASRKDPGGTGAGSAGALRQPQWRALMKPWIHSAGEEVGSFCSSRQTA